MASGPILFSLLDQFLSLEPSWHFLSLPDMASWMHLILSGSAGLGQAREMQSWSEGAQLLSFLWNLTPSHVKGSIIQIFV